jgi:hypothetical protein
MQDRPDLVELLESVRHFLETEVMPAAADARLRFRARVAANVLSVAARERALEGELLATERLRLRQLLLKAKDGPPAPERLHSEVEEMNTELAQKIRAGEIDASPERPAWKHLRQTAAEKLRIANPAYLKRIGQHGA